MTKTKAIKATAFGRVLGTLMETRGMGVNPERVTELAEKAGLEPERILARMAEEEEVVDVGPLNGLAKILSLMAWEKQILAQAFTFEQDDEAAGQLRAGLFDEVRMLLDASEAHIEDRVGVAAGRRVTEVLRPFLEVEAHHARELV
jgi:hypothetical protein